LLLVTFSFFLSFLFLWRMTTDQSYKSRATFDWGLTVGSHINRNLHSFTIFSFFLLTETFSFEMMKMVLISFLVVAILSVNMVSYFHFTSIHSLKFIVIHLLK
jgi:hypothetical protein